MGRHHHIDTGIRDRFVTLWQEYCPGAELPITFEIGEGDGSAENEKLPAAGAASSATLHGSGKGRLAMACYSWQVPKRMGPEQLIAQKHPKLVRVTVQEQIELKLREPRIVWDSLYGVVAERRASLRAGDSVAINLAHISKLEVEELDGVGTTLGILRAPGGRHRGSRDRRVLDGQ